jgi:CelD/BcsL family acetyltransferase involved in cellulose biosynthesis
VNQFARRRRVVRAQSNKLYQAWICCSRRVGLAENIKYVVREALRTTSRMNEEKGLIVTRLHSVEELEKILPEWEELDRQVFPRTPFTSPLWNTLWWRHFRAERGMVRDDFYVHVVRNAEGKLIAVAPLMLTHRPGNGIAMLRSLQFFGADPNLTELRGIICRAEDQASVAPALHAHFQKDRAHWDWVHWGSVRAEGLAQLLASGGALKYSRTVPNYCLPVGATWDEFKSKLPRNIKESLRKCYNSLKRDGYVPELKVVTSLPETEAAINRFFELHRVRAQVSDTVQHPDVFQTQTSRDFLLEYAKRMAERDQLRIFQLTIKDEVVATRVGFQFDRQLYLYYSGHDVAWAKYSVMTTAVAEAIKWAIEQGLSLVNLSTGTDVSKTRWRPEQVTFHEVVQVAPHLRGKISYAVYETMANKVRSSNWMQVVLAGLRRHEAKGEGEFSGPDAIPGFDTAL